VIFLVYFIFIYIFITHFMSLDGIPRVFLNREAINGDSVADAIARVTSYPCASGFSLNIG
jgi:hypothetical protein